DERHQTPARHRQKRETQEPGQRVRTLQQACRQRAKAGHRAKDDGDRRVYREIVNSAYPASGAGISKYRSRFTSWRPRETLSSTMPHPRLKKDNSATPVARTAVGRRGTRPVLRKVTMRG